MVIVLIRWHYRISDGLHVNWLFEEAAHDEKQ